MNDDVPRRNISDDEVNEELLIMKNFFDNPIVQTIVSLLVGFIFYKFTSVDAYFRIDDESGRLMMSVMCSITSFGWQFLVHVGLYQSFLNPTISDDNSQSGGDWGPLGLFIVGLKLVIAELVGPIGFIVTMVRLIIYLVKKLS